MPDIQEQQNSGYRGAIPDLVFIAVIEHESLAFFPRRDVVRNTKAAFVSVLRGHSEGDMEAESEIAGSRVWCDGRVAVQGGEKAEGEWCSGHEVRANDLIDEGSCTRTHVLCLWVPPASGDERVPGPVPRVHLVLPGLAGGVLDRVIRCHTKFQEPVVFSPHQSDIITRFQGLKPWQCLQGRVPGPDSSRREAWEVEECRRGPVLGPCAADCRSEQSRRGSTTIFFRRRGRSLVSR
mmetsp:Transcript_8896/g.25423  ORF Transcript_8896/g.25423 Transcript_8896/m.25423 type:complete len:236 (-) Transcript_8896:94-801(-)